MSVITDIADKLFKSHGESPEADLPEINDINEQTPDERKLAEYVRSKVDTVRQANSRLTLEGAYLTNVAYLMGFDGVVYDTTYRQFKNADPKRKLSKNRFKVNKILPSVQNRLARLTQSPPRYDVRPNSNSTEDKDAARLGLEVIKDVFDKQRIDEKRQDVIMSAMQGGHAYLQVLWDPTLGKPMIDPESTELNGYEGDVRLEVLNCLEVFPDPLAKSLEDAQYVIKAKVRKIDYFVERYPERGSAVKEEGAWLLSSVYDMKSNALTGVGIAGASIQDQMKNSAIELVYYERRSKDHPHGRMIVTASGILLEDKELPVGEFDLVKFDDIMIGGRYNPEAVITHLRPIQDQYTVTRTRMSNWVKAHLGGKYLVAKGSGLGQEAINNGDTEVVEYDPVPNAPPPQPMNIPAIPAYAYKEIEALDAEFDYISGINEISRGVLPSASMPAAGMAFLQEQDQTRIGVQTSRNEIGYGKVGSLILKYVASNYKMERLLKSAGEGLEYAVKEFVGADLQDNFDVIVVAGSTIPSSKVLRRQDLENVYNMGLMGDPADPKLRAKVLEMMEFGDTAEIWKKQALLEARSKKVIEAIEKGDEQGVMSLLSEFDKQEFFLDKMDDYRLSDKFLQLDDTKQKLFLWIIEWRLQALVNINNPQLAQQQLLAQTMVNNLHKMKAQGGMPGSPGVPVTDMSGNPVPVQPTAQAPMAQAPVPNATPQPTIPSIQQGA